MTKNKNLAASQLPLRKYSEAENLRCDVIGATCNEKEK